MPEKPKPDKTGDWEPPLDDEVAEEVLREMHATQEQEEADPEPSGKPAPATR